MSSTIWLAYIVNMFVTNTLLKTKQHCSGCRKDLKSPLLHFHIQASLLEKLKLYFEEVRGDMISSFEECFAAFVRDTNINLNKDQYLFSGQTFLLLATPESIYYGRFITEDIDARIRPRPCTLRILGVGACKKRKLNSSDNGNL